MTKQCSKCREVKGIELFLKKGAVCKGCWSMQCKAYREANKERIKAQSKEYYGANSETILKKNKAYRAANAEKLRGSKKEYNKANAARHAIYSKEYRTVNTERLKESKKEYYKANAGRINENRKEYNIEYCKANAGRIKKRQKEYILRLPESYVITRLKAQGFTKEDIEQNQILIEIKRIQIQTNRL